MMAIAPQTRRSVTGRPVRKGASALLCADAATLDLASGVIRSASGRVIATINDCATISLAQIGDEAGRARVLGYTIRAEGEAKGEGTIALAP